MFRVDDHVEQLFQKAQLSKREFRMLHGIDFCSNDYLSLKSNQIIKQDLMQFFTRENTWCSTGSRLVSGHSEQLSQLESEFAQFVDRPCALFFANGYQANIATIATLFTNCVAFSDELNHASIIDGIRLSGSEKFIYRHNDLNHLEESLRRFSHKPRAIISESVVSTSGQRVDIASLIFLARKYHALLMVDEAHATGIYGQSGAGVLDGLDHRDDNIISTHSCGKALASFGAFVACSQKICAIIQNISRSFICTTTPPPYLVAHVRAALRCIKKDATHRERLHDNVAYADGVLKTASPIIPILVNDDQSALLIRDRLARRGFDIAVFRYPSVPLHQAQLRITLHSGNTKEHIDLLRQELENLL